MSSILIKRAAAIILGALVGVAIVTLTDVLSGKLFPPPPGTDFKNPASLKAMIDQMPLAAFVLLLVGYTIASFVGGAVACLISGRTQLRPSMIVGGVLMVGGLMNATMVPHPLWFVAANFVIYLPAAWLGYTVCKTKA